VVLQAGNKLRAMKALLKCQDTQKIIYFASKCRSKDIYVLAANYLQTLDWRSETEVLDSIIAFYTKGKALDKLSSFYEAAAQNEIDDYQSYDKALHALREALSYLDKMMMNRAKVKDIADIESRVNGLNTKIELIERFVKIKEMRDSDPEEMMGRCHALLEEPDIDFALRVGDVYGLMIDCLANMQQFAEAYEMMKTMRHKIPNVNISYYVDLQVVETIENALGVAKGHGRGAEEELKGGFEDGTADSTADRPHGEVGDDDDIGEDVVDRPLTSHGGARPSTRGGFLDRMAMQDSDA
jgi:intraflagellar transport protein 140